MTDEERAAVMKAYLEATAPGSWIFAAGTSTLPPGGIVAPPSPPAPEPEAKPVKPIHEMRFADYQRGVEAWWPSRKR